MRKEYCELKTVGDLREFIRELPDDMPVVRLTDGYYQVNVVGIGAFVGDLQMGDSRPVQTDNQNVMRLHA